MMKILLLGDIVGTAARDFLCAQLWSWRQRLGASLVIANAENVCMGGGNGLDRESATLLLQGGIDVLTGGNHSFAKQNLHGLLEDSDVILRPANYPDRAPGKGHTVVEADGVRVLVINLAGRVYMDAADDPFVCLSRILRAGEGRYDVAVVDFHAEATAEKAALARAFDGTIAACVGTHTHVQTADARILPRGTAFLTDLGMCGPVDSILGVKSESIIHKLRTGLPTRFELAQGTLCLQGALLTLAENLQPVSIEPISVEQSDF